MGGIDGNSYTNDAFVLDTKTEQIERVLEQKAGSTWRTQHLRFASVNNASAQAAENVVVALVIGDDSKPYLIQYALDSKSIAIEQFIIEF